MDTCWGQPRFPVNSAVVEGKGITDKTTDAQVVTVNEVGHPKISCSVGIGSVYKMRCDLYVFDAKRCTGSTTCVAPW